MRDPADSSTRIRGYVLAGGGSTRFGRDKALVEFAGTPLLLQIIKLVETCASPVTLIASAERYRHLDAELEIVEDRWPGEGPLGGIITALQHSVEANPACRWNLLLSCDMPFLTTAWLKFLTDRARDSLPETQVLLPHSAHGPEPLCACYRTDAVEALRNVFATGIRKVTAALRQLPTEVLDESAWKRFDSAGRLFWNMNTPADFIEVQRLWETQKS
jgi:molybdopterin-guanine dinucleotide biosynthesis protein A